MNGLFVYTQSLLKSIHRYSQSGGHIGGYSVGPTPLIAFCVDRSNWVCCNLPRNAHDNHRRINLVAA